MKCVVQDCDQETVARNLCKKHYTRYKRHGDLTIVKHKSHNYPPHSKCIVPDCNRKSKVKNMCNMHYRRYKNHGDPTIIKHGEPLRYLHKNVLTYKDEECLPWPYGRNADGYGIVHIDEVRKYVHTVICEMVNGPRPSQNHVASHKCGKGHLGCVNPKHLKWQTRKEDSADKVTHGTVVRGSKNWKSRLTDETVREIRSLENKLSQTEIAKKFGIHVNTVGQIIRRINWDWLE